jgi:hypothetical protein
VRARELMGVKMHKDEAYRLVETLTLTNRVSFTHQPEGFLNVKMSVMHLLLIKKRWEKEGWRRLARQREVG